MKAKATGTLEAPKERAVTVGHPQPSMRLRKAWASRQLLQPLQPATAAAQGQGLATQPSCPLLRLRKAGSAHVPLKGLYEVSRGEATSK